MFVYIRAYNYNKQHYLKQCASHYKHIWYMDDNTLIDEYISYYHSIFVIECYSMQDFRRHFRLGNEIIERWLDDKLKTIMQERGIE